MHRGISSPASPPDPLAAWALWICASACARATTSAASGEDHRPPAVEASPASPRSLPPAHAPGGDRCELDDAAQQRCASSWAALRAGDLSSTPLEQRCRLAATLVTAMVEAADLARTTWLQLDGESVGAVVLVAPELRTRGSLIAYDESCPQLRVPRTGAATLAVDVLGRVERPTRPALALQLDAARPGDCGCAARFSWRLGDRIGWMQPPIPQPDGGVRVLLAPTVALPGQRRARPRQHDLRLAPGQLPAPRHRTLGLPPRPLLPPPVLAQTPRP